MPKKTAFKNNTSAKSVSDKTNKLSRKDHIFQAALNCFSRQGVKRTNMTDVAAEAGVSRPSIYYYFKDKQSLLVEVVLRLQTDAYQTRNKSGGNEATGVEAIIEAATLGVESSLNNPYMKMITKFEAERLMEAALNSEIAMKVRTEYWGVLLDDAKRLGELRTDVSDKEIIRWLVFLQFQMVTNGHQMGCYDYASIRQIFELFLLPALSISATPLT